MHDYMTWREHMEAMLDEALQETFPASDPVAISVSHGPSVPNRSPAKAQRQTGDGKKNESQEK